MNIGFMTTCIYDKMLSKSIEPWMIIPMDEEGKVLEESDKCYEEAKSRVLFKGGKYYGFSILLESLENKRVAICTFLRDDEGEFYLQGGTTLNDLAISGVELTEEGVKYFGLK